MITHQMEVIKQIADRVAVIENGRIIEESSVVDLFTAPKTETSRKFIGSVISNDIPESLQHMHFTPEKQHPGDLTALRLSFRGDVADEPIVANLIRKYNLDVSILTGTLTTSTAFPSASSSSPWTGTKRIFPPHSPT